MDLIERQAAIDGINNICPVDTEYDCTLLDRVDVRCVLSDLPSAEPEQEDYTELKREFLRMASYIDVLLECSDVQKETLIGFISRLAEFMPWTERD